MRRTESTTPASASQDPTLRWEAAMEHALALAARAGRAGDVPVGAVVLDESGAIIGAGENRREQSADPTAHAEILALREAAKVLGTWRLSQCTLVVTLEPCPMCAGALVASRIQRVVYGCRDPKGGAVTTLYAIPEDPRLNHTVQVVEGVYQEECSTLLRSFFEGLRSRGPVADPRRAGRAAEGA